MSDEQKHAIEYAKKVLRGVKLYDLAASLESVAITPESVGLPSYPIGNVVGACVCGSWPGGECLKCKVIPPTQGADAQFIAEHGHRLAELLKLDYYDIADRDAQITMLLANKLPQPSQGADARPVAISDEMIAAAIDAESKHNEYANRIKAVQFHKLPVREQMRLRIAAAIAAIAPRGRT